MINSERWRKLSIGEYKGGTVVYQMCRELRAEDNDALLFAQSLANKHNAPLIVNYVIWNYMWEGATRRFYDWVLPSLQETEKILRTHNIPLVVTFEENRLSSPYKKREIPNSIGAVVIDSLPLCFMSIWKERFLEHHSHVPLYEVDAHNIIPVWITSNKQEFAARTIRSKLHGKIKNYLEDSQSIQHHGANNAIIQTFPLINWKEVSSRIICDESISGIGIFVPGTHAGHEILKHFFKEKLSLYNTARNDINKDGQSNLSPYISHGNISRRHIILELLKHEKITIEGAFDPNKNGSNGTMGSIAAFIEECVVRSELAENFCYYNKNYKTTQSFPEWARNTLKKGLTDKREHIYSLEEFKQAKTHDDLWNAAQQEMVLHGKMHGYMRMYWAKKILEWTKSPEDALRIANYLNDTYELDGRDPNGYVGCAWSIGGVHDRPWFPRPIFGTVRYMARSGVEKRGDAKEYIRSNTNPC